MALPHSGKAHTHQSTFTRLYANDLGHIANSDPRIEQVFNKWRNTQRRRPLEKPARPQERDA